MEADLAREDHALIELIEKSSGAVGQRESVGFLATQGLSIRLSCRCVKLSRKSVLGSNLGASSSKCC